MNIQNKWLPNLSLKLETSRLLIANSKLDELTTLQKFYADFSSYMEAYTGHTDWDIRDVAKKFSDGDVPPGGVKENYQLKSIYLKSTNECIGYLELYNGHPTPSIYYIGTLYVDKAVQHQGIGIEVVDGLYHHIKMNGFEAMRMGVDAKNWPALYFWYSCGFRTLTKLKGDKVLTDKTFMTIELERSC